MLLRHDGRESQYKTELSLLVTKAVVVKWCKPWFLAVPIRLASLLCAGKSHIFPPFLTLKLLRIIFCYHCIECWGRGGEIFLKLCAAFSQSKSCWNMLITPFIPTPSLIRHLRVMFHLFLYKYPEDLLYFQRKSEQKIRD